MQDQFTIGPARPDEEPYVLGTWREAAWRSHDGRGMRRSQFNAKHNAIMDGVLARGAHLLVARIPDAPDVALGWACGLELVDAYAVVFAYTRFQSRQNGVMRALVHELVRAAPALPLVYCARTRFSHVFDRYGMLHRPLTDGAVWMGRAA